MGVGSGRAASRSRRSTRGREHRRPIRPDPPPSRRRGPGGDSVVADPRRRRGDRARDRRCASSPARTCGPTRCCRSTSPGSRSRTCARRCATTARRRCTTCCCTSGWQIFGTGNEAVAFALGGLRRHRARARVVRRPPPRRAADRRRAPSCRFAHRSRGRRCCCSRRRRSRSGTRPKRACTRWSCCSCSSATSRCCACSTSRRGVGCSCLAAVTALLLYTHYWAFALLGVVGLWLVFARRAGPDGATPPGARSRSVRSASAR